MNPQVFVRSNELKLLSLDMLSKKGWDSYLCEPLRHFRLISWHHLHYPCFEYATLPSIHSQSLHVLQTVKQLMCEKKAAFQKF
jgi:hypothetical protein